MGHEEEVRHYSRQVLTAVESSRSETESCRRELGSRWGRAVEEGRRGSVRGSRAGE